MDPNRPSNTSTRGKDRVKTPPADKPKGGRLGPVSAAELLGLSGPRTHNTPRLPDPESLPENLRPFLAALLNIRDRLTSRVTTQSKEHFQNAREASGELSGYSLHMADAGTDNWDREFALSLISSDQDLLKEVDDAIDRIREGTYGICEVSGEPIAESRLKAIPWTRYTVEAQKEMEKYKKRRIPRPNPSSYDIEDLEEE
jgi:RNA polymerase-binding transcription factor DksA